MSQIMPISNESWFQQQQQRYFSNAAAQTVYPSSPTSTLSHDAITVSTQEPSNKPILTSQKSTQFTMSPNSNSKGKPIRRRSRASKKTPVTLLNADVKDFRALVQRFTGCRTSEISFSTRNHRKGPVNLNFAASSTHHLLPPNANSASSEIGFNNYQQQHDHQLPHAAQGPYYYNNFNWRTEAPAEEDQYYKSNEQHDDMYAMNNNYMQTSAEFQSLDDIDDLKLDDIGTSLHELIGDIIT